jgi:UDP-N-acetylmuramyl pentapeptide phosphotransferase/UDP-N-acetylglucosamine-1-phosphate transferase
MRPMISGLWFVNLVNFMDGIDWMTVAEVVLITTTLTALGIVGALPPYGTVLVLALALGGAMIGFAYFNRPVAKVFLGFTTIAVVARVFAVNVGLGILAIFSVIAPGRPSEIAALAVGAVLVAGLLTAFERGRT